MAMVAYTGIESITQLTAEAKHPGIVVPKAIRRAMVVLVALYLGISVVGLSAVTPAELGTTYLLNPIEGIELYRKHQASIAMVLLDYSMPGMDGKAAFQELLKINKDVKVLICSGYSGEEMESAFGDVRAAGFIHKPYQPAELLERVSQVLAE
jgi:CheY-like chemotaxis protein